MFVILGNDWKEIRDNYSEFKNSFGFYGRTNDNSFRYGLFK
jgi:hypothetical protein